MNIIKRIVNIVLSAAISIGCVGAVYRNYESEYSFICLAAGDYLGVETNDDGTLAISKYTGTAETVVIPATHNGRKITSIKRDVFKKNQSIKKVVFSENLKRIEYCAFASCQNLEIVEFPDSLEVVEEYAFDRCSKLSTANLNNVKEVGNCAFQLCTSLTFIHIPGSLTTLVNHAFHGCENVSTMVIAEGVKTIEKDAALNLYNLKNITIPKSVTSIADNSLGFFYSSGNYIKSDDVTFNVYSNSAGLEYAKKFGFNYVVIDSLLTNPNATYPNIVRPPVNTSVTTATPVYIIGDVNSDEAIDSLDASTVLAEYSAIQTGNNSLLGSSQEKAADLNGDGLVNSSDASEILRYYSELSTGKTPTWNNN